MAEGGGAGVVGDDDSSIPRDARIVKTLLKSMGVNDYEPRVVNQFLEFWYRYVVDVLSDAQIYSEHASKLTIDVEDVKLAIQTRVNSSFSQPPPREVLLDLARNRNKMPLPKTILSGGMPLPPEQDTLINPNYQLLIPKRQAAEEEQDEETEAGAAATAIPNPSPTANVNLAQEHQRVSFSMVTANRPR